MSRALKVLNVAEKPSVAKEVSRILSGGTARFKQSCAPYNGLYEFSFTLNGVTCTMTFTSVSGHLKELDFPSEFKKWRSCSPLELYSAPVQKIIPQEKLPLEQNLQQQSRLHQWLVLWLDCDREGENIAFEVIDVCRIANPRLVVKRARFSALISRDLHHAINNLVEPNENDAKAVDARQELDLRIGASFTRFQTLLLQDKFEWSEHAAEPGQAKLISYGPCQFPTLGLIVQRAWEIQAHLPEAFWHIHLAYSAADGSACDFTWDRGHLFDHDLATVLYEACCECPHATVIQVSGLNRQRYPPPPLSTLEMQKKATTSLRIPGERVMKLAEELYQSGYISYPRTETDTFDEGYDLRAMISEQAGDARWGDHAQKILDGPMWKPPANGGHNDQAHPPIHPTKYSSGETDWSLDKKKLYEFIVRSFLATCSKAAVGRETRIEVSIAEESFHSTGLMVLERNWLEVYPYTGWGGNANLPLLRAGEIFCPTQLLLKEGMTQPPSRLTERDLISLMENYGIGTDATVAEHIQKQLDRGYASKDENLAFWPTPLGEGLVGGYRKMGLQNLWLPDLRGKIEHNITMVARSQRAKDDVLQEAIEHFQEDFRIASCRQGILEAEMSRFFGRVDQSSSLQGVSNEIIGPCPLCSCSVQLNRHEAAPASISCSGRPLCSFHLVLPRSTTHAEVSPQFCPACHHGLVRKVDLRFRRSAVPGGTRSQHLACVICDSTIQQLLQQLGQSSTAASRSATSTRTASRGLRPPRPHGARRGRAVQAGRLARGRVMTVQAQHAEQAAGRGDQNCYKCGRTGHYARDCAIA